MTESQLKLGNDLTKDKSVVYEQMKDMKNQISGCARKTYETADCKEDFDSFKQDLLNQCDKWVEAQRAKIDQKFAVI